MRKLPVISILALSAFATAAHAGLVNFSYTQTTTASGSGSIAPFSFMGHNFTATPLSAVVFNPNPLLTPAGFVGAQTVAGSDRNESNTVTGLIFSGSVTAMSDDGYLIDIPLDFVPKQTQAPDVNDYTWNVVWGDSVANGTDTVSSANIRVAMWYSRDDLVDASDTPNRYQRYTQQNNISFTAGQNTFTNTDTSFNAATIKDAMDSGDPQGTDAVGRDLAFYWGWRDQATLTSGAVLIDDFTVGGLLNTDETTLRPVVVPEPSSVLLALTGSLLLLRRRR
jgi:hypothetical protein